MKGPILNFSSWPCTGQSPLWRIKGQTHSFAFCRKGEAGFIQVKHIVSCLPDLDERQNQRQRRSLVSGFLIEEDDEERSYPTTIKQMEHFRKVFYIKLLMCISAFPQYKQLSVSLEELVQFYTWLHGPSI